MPPVIANLSKGKRRELIEKCLAVKSEDELSSRLLSQEAIFGEVSVEWSKAFSQVSFGMQSGKKVKGALIGISVSVCTHTHWTAQKWPLLTITSH